MRRSNCSSFTRRVNTAATFVQTAAAAPSAPTPLTARAASASLSAISKLLQAATAQQLQLPGERGSKAEKACLCEVRR
jgi:hypothetical protein